jgi:alpha-ketoglutarate-dependent taurine dioxygenase
MAFAAELGEPVPTRSGGPVVDELSPVDPSAARKRSLSAVHGVGAFPFHTDGAHHRLPPRWVVMRCAEPGGDRPTLLVDGAQLPLHRRHWRTVERAVWWVHSGMRSFPASIVGRSPRGRFLRYDRGCMAPAHPVFAEAAHMLEAAIGATTHLPLSWKVNDVVVFDNWRVLHARGSTSLPDTSVRLLERILVR